MRDTIWIPIFVLYVKPIIRKGTPYGMNVKYKFEIKVSIIINNISIIVMSAH